MADPAKIIVPPLLLNRLISEMPAAPSMVRASVRRPAATPLRDLEAELAEQLREPLAAVAPGDRVALAVGSRGIARLADIVATIVQLIRDGGADPFIVPAMGSHGGATQEGQLGVLVDLGITPALAPIEASMDVIVVGQVQDLAVHTSAAAAAADHVLLVNRVKSHTSFTGSIESGLAKMAAIGLGKQRGAEELHRLGPLHLERRILTAVDLLRARLPLLGGVAVVEGRDKTVDAVQFLPPEAIGSAKEAQLLDLAKGLEARLPFTNLDVLVVDLMGKEISGTGMDTNVIGRRMVRGSPEPGGIAVTNLVVLEVTPGSEGNAVGLGLADFVPASLLAGVDLAATYANALTAGLQGVQRAQVPIVLATAADAVLAALHTAGTADPVAARVARIRSTLALDEVMVSTTLLEEFGDLLEPRTAPAPLVDPSGALISWAHSDPPDQE